MKDGNKKVIILGAGPAGLSAGLELSKGGYEVVIVEREGRIGGISKTIQYKGFRFDVGAHRFFTKDKEVEDIWVNTLGKDFRKTPRLSRIFYNNKFYKYPIELKDTLKKAGITTSMLCISSYLRYKILPIKPEVSFADWTTNRFGKKLFLMFFKSYTEKVWGISTDELSADWAAQRIKGLSLWEAIRNAIFKPKTKAKSLIEEFMYPKYGSGMMYEAMAKRIKKNGGAILLNTDVIRINHKDGLVRSIEIVGKQQQKDLIKGDFFISTIPLPKTIEFLSPEVPLRKNIGSSLKFRDFMIVDLIVKQKDIFPDIWLYVHDPKVMLGRIENFKNWSKYMTPSAALTPIGCEYFCNQGDAVWSAKDIDLIKLATKEVEALGLIHEGRVVDGTVYRVRDAYPVYMGGYKHAIGKARKILDRFNNLQVAGRGGMFRYNNMDHSILAGLYTARNIMGGNFDIWQINEEKEYHEKKK